MDDSSEKVTYEQNNLSRTWYAGESKDYHHQVYDDTLGDEHENEIIDDPRERSEQNCSDNSKPSLTQELVDL